MKGCGGLSVWWEALRWSWVLVLLLLILLWCYARGDRILAVNAARLTTMTLLCCVYLRALTEIEVLATEQG